MNDDRTPAPDPGDREGSFSEEATASHEARVPSRRDAAPGFLSSILARWRLYSSMSQLGLVARRFFVKNMTDGILTTLGVVIGFFVVFLNDPAKISSTVIIILPGVGTAVAMCVSGVLASYLVESAERKKAFMDMQREMVMIEGTARKGSRRRRRVRTLQERAERFATIIASLIDGFSPFAAALIVLLPFYFTAVPEAWEFLAAIMISCVLLFLLGSYLATLSKAALVVYGLKMVLMGLLTLIITFLLGLVQ